MTTNNMDNKETSRPAFTDPPGTILAGIPISNLKLINPDVSYGLPYYESCAKHIADTFKASKVYIVASKSLCANTDKLDTLIDAIGKDKVVGTRKGITPHTPWSEILQITKECRDAKVDCLVTLGAGSITDGCKLVVLVSTNHATRYQNEHLTRQGPREQHLDPRNSSPIFRRKLQYPYQRCRTKSPSHHHSNQP
jgi:hypothetical protein